MRSNTRWTVEDNAELQRLLTQGGSLALIALALGRSQSAVSARMWTRGFKFGQFRPRARQVGFLGPPVRAKGAPQARTAATPCPFCGAAPYTPCLNLGRGFHHERSLASRQ